MLYGNTPLCVQSQVPATCRSELRTYHTFSELAAIIHRTQACPGEVSFSSALATDLMQDLPPAALNKHNLSLNAERTNIIPKRKFQLLSILLIKVEIITLMSWGDSQTGTPDIHDNYVFV